MKVSEILEAMAALSEDDLGLLFHSLSMGVWDEWDCDLPTALKNFGETEMMVAVKSAVYAAKAVENTPTTRENE
jgi:hypothetical protein